MVVVVYEAVLPQITQRLRFPKMITHIRDRFSNEGELLFSELLEHGSLTSEQAIKQATAVTVRILGMHKSLLKLTSTGSAVEHKEQEKLTKIFQILAQENYIQPASSFVVSDEPIPEPTPEKETKKKRGRKSKTQEPEPEPMDLEAPKPVCYFPYHLILFSFKPGYGELIWINLIYTSETR